MLVFATPSGAAPDAKTPLPAYSVEITTNAVIVSTMNVSMNTPTIATTPCSCGSFTLAIACACGVLPIPASLENRPRFAPCEIAVFSA